MAMAVIAGLDSDLRTSINSSSRAGPTHNRDEGTAGAEPLARSPDVCVWVLVMSLLVCGGGKKEAREGLLGAVRLAHTTTTALSTLHARPTQLYLCG
jgi:hypothetical protein